MFHLTVRHQVLWFSNLSNILLSRGAWKLGLFLFSPYGAAHLNHIQYPYDFTISPLQWIGYIYIHMVDQAQRGQQPETFAELLMNLRLLWFRLVQPTPPLLPHPCKSSIAMHCTHRLHRKKDRYSQSGEKTTALVVKMARLAGRVFLSQQLLLYFLICQFYFLPSPGRGRSCVLPAGIETLLRHWILRSVCDRLASLIISISCNQHPSESSVQGTECSSGSKRR